MLKNDKIKVYRVDFDSIVTALSLVDEPAIESNFVCLSKQEEKKQITLSQERMMLYGAALIPDKLIYRYDEIDGEYYITFPKETIEKLAHDFLSKGRVNSFTTQHLKDTNTISLIESWIKTSESDKSNELGFDLPIGTWFVGCKVHDYGIWEEIKEGKMNGFSIESFLGLTEMKFNKINKEEKMSQTITVDDNFFTKLFDAIKGALQEPETPELEANVTAATVVDDIKEEVIEQPIVEEEPTAILEEEIPTVVEEPIAEEIADEVVEEVVEVEPTQEEATDTLQEVINELNQKIDELNAEIDALRKENQKLSKQPSTKPISTRMSKNDNQSNFDRMLAIMNGSAFQK